MPRRLALARHLGHLLDEQDAVLTQAQAHECGYTRSSIQHAVDAGRWQRLLPGVLLMHDQPPTRRQLVNAAALWAGPDSSIDAESACLWHGIPVSHADEQQVHIVVPHESGARSRDFVVVRRSGLIVRGGQGQVASYVDAATAAVMAARRTSNDRAAVALLSQPLQVGLVTLEDLFVVIMRRPPRGARRVARALEQLAAGVRSAGESIARDLFAHSVVLPKVQWNRWLRLPDGGPLVCATGSSSTRAWWSR